MAGWMTVLKRVPWGDVLTHAPEIAERARTLWSAVGRKADQPAVETDLATAPDPIAGLIQRVSQNENAASELRAQLAACSELLAQMAEQNRLLIARMEALRRNSKWLALVASVSLAAALSALVWIGSKT